MSITQPQALHIKHQCCLTTLRARTCATTPAVAPMATLAAGCHHVARDARSSGSCAFSWSYNANDTAKYGTTVAPDSSAPLYNPATASQKLLLYPPTDTADSEQLQRGLPPYLHRCIMQGGNDPQAAILNTLHKKRRNNQHYHAVTSCGSGCVGRGGAAAGDAGQSDSLNSVPLKCS